jgi:alpha-L-fucosidase
LYFQTAHICALAGGNQLGLDCQAFHPIRLRSIRRGSLKLKHKPMRLHPTMNRPFSSFISCCACGTTLFTATLNAADTKSEAKDQHAAIGVTESKDIFHNTNAAAQWFPPAGFGLFLHWGIAAVQGGAVVNHGDLSWAMQPKGLMNKRIDDPAERERIIRERDWNLDGKPPLTPNQYWALAKDFNPQSYDPEKWCAAAKAAGFSYVVLTTRHHDGFALWPSDYGDLSTKDFMGGRDLVKPFVEACRKYGLKVGLYYSPPNWHFDRESMDFLYYRAHAKNPEFPKLDADLKPRTNQLSAEELKRHNAEVDAMVKGQVEELLTRYGKIDYLWFDGGPSSGNRQCITRERIQELQPGIVIGPRLHGKGDLITFESNTVTDDTMKKAALLNGWAEWCLTWTPSGWSYHKGRPLADDGWVLSRLAAARSLGVNMLLDLGPTEQGELDADAYKHLANVASWMKANGVAVHEAKPLLVGETASVPATALGNTRYLFACPKYAVKEGNRVAFDNDLLPAQDETLTLNGIGPVKSVILLGDGKEVAHEYAGKTLTIHLPAARRTKLPDVVAVELEAEK